nr:uncharacterized protein LOC121127635 isoform X1 [Lepeophtheirus salmonis]
MHNIFFSLSFLIHSLSYVLLFNSGFQIYNGFEALFKSDISFDIFLRNLGLLTYPLNKLELAIERQNEFMEGFNTVQEEEKKLEKLMIHAKLQKLNGHIKDYENTIRNIETKAMESNCQLQDIMDGFPLQDHEMIALIINFKDIFHHILLILYHLGYVFGYVGSNCRLGALVLHGFIGIQAHTYIEWDFNHWMLYFAYMQMQMILAIRYLKYESKIHNNFLLDNRRSPEKNENYCLEEYKILFFIMLVCMVLETS